jgi:DNA-directed RNA polymerase subunit RPC12/RpoP
MSNLDEKRMFPCPVCGAPCEVKLTKKGKPYIVCDPCGIQVFVRGPAGIAALDRLVERGKDEGLWTRIAEMEQRYRLKCRKCGCQFWIEPDLIETSVWDGSFRGFQSPGKNCRAIVAWGKKR